MTKRISRIRRTTLDRETRAESSASTRGWLDAVPTLSVERQVPQRLEPTEFRALTGFTDTRRCD